MTPSKAELYNALENRHGVEIQKKFKAACIGIAGLGGLGSNIAVHLARMGVEHLVLADFDIVDITNLNRQHYTIQHLGTPKTEALISQLLDINPYLRCEVHNTRITAHNAVELFKDCSIVCEAFDLPDQKAMLIETLLADSPDTYIVSGNGMAGFDTANTIQVRQKIGRLFICGDGTSDVGQVHGLYAPRVSVCASHQATAVLRLLLGLAP